MTRVHSIAWTAVLVFFAGAAIVAYRRRHLEAPRHAQDRSVGWNTANEIKQAASNAIPREPGAWQGRKRAEHPCSEAGCERPRTMTEWWNASFPPEAQCCRANDQCGSAAHLNG